MRRLDRATCLLAITMSVGSRAPAAAAESSERVAIRGELGAEYDDNVHRAEVLSGAVEPPRVGSPVTRAVLGLTSTAALSHGQDVAFSLLGAGKLFLASAARSENVLVVDTAGSWRITTDRRGKLGLSATYYEAAQNVTPAERALSGEARDFRSIVPTLRVLRYLSSGDSLTLGAGFRSFVYKAQRDYDFQAPVFTVEYRLARETADGVADWEMTASTSLELRRFAGERLVSNPTGCAAGSCLPVVDPTGAHHVDQFLTAQAEVTRTGRLLVGAGYAIQWNRSNSLFESLVRHIGAVRLTAPLPFGLYLAARAELVFVTYPDKLTLATSVAGQPITSIEEESRSHLRAELSRDLTGHLQLMARYSYYANALGQSAGDYRRQTATVSLVYSSTD